MAKRGLTIWAGGLVLAVACGAPESGTGVGQKSPGATNGSSTSAASRAPATKLRGAQEIAPSLTEGAPSACKLLEDRASRAKLSAAFESKLLVQCGKVRRPTHPAPQLSGSFKPRSLKASAAPGTDILVNDPGLDTGGSTQSETSVVAVGNVVCVSWNDAGEGFGANGFAGFGYSLDGGQTFKDGGPFPNAPSGDESFGDPSLAYSARDSAFYFASLSSSGLSLWKSSDTCQSFQYVGVIHSGFGDDKELMAIDNNASSPYYGRIYVGWTDFASSNDINAVTYSDDGGLSFTSEKHLPGSGSSGQGVYPAVAPNGDVFMAFVSQDFFAGGHQDQWIYRSVDGGDTWTKQADIGTDQLQPEDEQASNDCGRPALNGHIRNLPSPQIVVTADGSASVGYVVHAVYPYDSDGDGPDHSNVFYRRSADGGATWSPEVMLNDDGTTTDQFVPVIGASEDGLLAVSFYDRRLDPTNNLGFDRYLTVSLDGGNTWSANERISDVTSPVAQTLPNFDGLATCYHGDYDQVALSGSTAHVVWSDDRRTTASGPNPDVYYDQYALNPHLGRLTSTASAVSCSATLGFGVSDIDLAGTGGASIALETTTGDSETLVLTESTDKPGKFAGTIATTSGTVTPGNGALEVSDTATITATYQDADDGNGNPRTVTLTVKVDCSPPTITNVHLAALTGTTAAVAVDSSEPASLKVDYGFSCGTLAQSVTSKLSPTPTANITDLYSGYQYFYAVTATDAYGNSVHDDNGGKCYSFKTLDKIYNQDFEQGLDSYEIGDPGAGTGGGTSGAAGMGTGGIGSGGIGTGGTFTAGTGGRAAGGRGSGGTSIGGTSTGGTGTGGSVTAGTSTGAVGGTGEAGIGSAGAPEGGTAGSGGSGGLLGGGLWHLSESCASAIVGHTRPNTLYYGDDSICTYDRGTTNGVVTSPTITLSDATFATVEFNYFLETEGGGYYDRASFEISVNGGPFQVVTSNFTTLLKPEPDDPHQYRTREDAKPAGRYELEENTGKWQHSVSDLTPYLGGSGSAQIRLRFHFDTVDPIANSYAGFYVDDVTVFGIAPPKPCTQDADCDDGRFCTGTETCQAGFCAKGQPVVCSGGDDGIPCTQYACDETTRGCAQVPNDDLCDDGLYCNGAERCNVTAGCQQGTPVTCNGGSVSCVVGQCDEQLKTCTQIADSSKCDDGLFCDGFEYCDPTLGCQKTPPPCVDGVNCTDDLCDEATYSCTFVPQDTRCNDGLFCDGQEYCDPYQGCRTTTAPCSIGDKCDEGGDQCIPICFTDTNDHHATAGRAYAKKKGYYALGSNDSLGKAADTTSLQGYGNYFKRVASCPAPPTVNSVSVSVSGDTATVSGTASDPNGDLLKVRLTFYVFLYYQETLDATGTTNYTGSLGLPPGVHAVSVQAYDKAGFVSAPSELIYFEVSQPQPPTIDSIAVTTSGNSVTVSGTASDPNDDVTRVVITVLNSSGVVVASTTAKGTATWSGTIASLAPGSYSARAQAFDSYGYASTLTDPVPFTIGAPPQCITDTNGHHKTAGRATLESGTYYAVGSHDSLGKKANAMTSLSGTAGDWHKVNKCP